MKLFSLVALLLLSFPTTSVGETRGIRNYNPANLVKTRIKWQGKVRKCSDKRFECFTTPFYGIRAMYKVLRTYYYKHKRQTIREIVRKWSPAHENETERIIRDISKRVAWEPDDPIPINNPNFLYTLGSSLIINENGVDPYPISLHRRAINNAFGNNNIIRKYGSRRDSKAMVNEHEGQSRTTEGLNREDKYKEQGSREGKRSNEQRVQLHKENNRPIFSLRNYCIPSSGSSFLRNGRNTWLDRMGEWFLILYRWKGCATMENGNWTGNNTPTYPSSSRDIWNVFRVKYHREPLVPVYIV